MPRNIRYKEEKLHVKELRSFLVRSLIFSEQVIDDNDDIAGILILLLPTT